VHGVYIIDYKVDAKDCFESQINDHASYGDHEISSDSECYDDFNFLYKSDNDSEVATYFMTEKGSLPSYI